MALTPTNSKDRYFEDYLPGAVFEYGEIRVDEAEIIEFASRFDPQDSWAAGPGKIPACSKTIA